LPLCLQNTQKSTAIEPANAWRWLAQPRTPRRRRPGWNLPTNGSASPNRRTGTPRSAAKFLFRSVLISFVHGTFASGDASPRCFRARSAILQLCENVRPIDPLGSFRKPVRGQDSFDHHRIVPAPGSGALREGFPTGDQKSGISDQLGALIGPQSQVAIFECSRSRKLLHCAKAVTRSKIWQPEFWPDRSGVPTLAEAMVEHGKLGDTVPEMQAIIDKDAAERLY